MKVTTSLRLKEKDAERIQAFAKENKTTTSAMIAYKMRQYASGDLQFTVPDNMDVRQTSAAIPVEDMVAFKNLIQKLGLPMDEAMRQLTACLVNDLKQHDEP